MMSNKSVLIMDTPENCSDCYCSEIYSCESGRCAFINKKLNNKMYGKPTWCPLKPLPKRESNVDFIDPLYGGGYVYGFNSCLDMITGEDNDG